MSRLNVITLTAGGVAATLLILCLLSSGQRYAQVPDGPHKLSEVPHIARNLGLHVRSDTCDDTPSDRLVISEQPLSWERVSDLRFADLDHPCWLGTVAVCAPRRAYAHYEGSNGATVWGNTLVIGDRDLIERLTGSSPKKAG